MALPPLRADGTLPPGEHRTAMLAEVFAAFPAASARRHTLDAALAQLVAVVTRHSLATDLVIDGSYTTDKVEPEDIDVALLSTGAGETATLQRLQAEGVDLTLMDVFVSVAIPEFERWVRFFSADRSGHIRGVIALTV